MTDSDEPDEHASHDAALAQLPDVPLGQDLRAIVGQPQLGDTFEKLFACALLDVEVGWPRLIEGRSAKENERSAARAWLRAGDVVIELARSPASSPLELGLSLGASSAVQLVDALLGGRVGSTISSASGQPSEAECGVLAYAAARLVAATRQPWILRDVRDWEGPDGGPSMLLWPVALRTSMGTLDATVWLSRALAEHGQARHPVEVLVQESAVSGQLDRLTVGDVWLCEGSGLTLTSEGLTGPVVVSVTGTAARLSAQLRRNRVRVRGPAGATKDGGAQPFVGSSAAQEPVELVIGGSSLTLLELAQLASGQLFDLHCDGAREGALCRGGVTFARGQLVAWRGAIGLRVHER
ncbi:MAG: hypothetical protein JWN04_945 [Myxococcaceae bacterium]|nr:hypothetical protein [Myxococcaceae bacterium]